MPLKIAGDGPMQNYVRERAASIAGVEYLGICAHIRVLELLKDAALLVFPSRWYEGMPMIVLEAFACGTPVIGFGLGSMNDLIVDGVNGSKLELENPDALLDFFERSTASYGKWLPVKRAPGRPRVFRREFYR